MNKILFFLFFILFSNNIYAQNKTGFAIDPSENNIAALFTMTNEEGRIKNLNLMESIFQDKSLGFNCEKHHNVSSVFIYNKLTELASKLDDNATLLLYFNSHGGGSGNRFMMTAREGSFTFSKALEALRKSTKKIKRLIFLVDTCHAEGSIQDSLKENGELLKKIQTAKPTNFLPELPDKFIIDQMPFTSIFLNYTKEKNVTYIENNINYGENSGVYDEILIISSCSVEDLSIRGVFAYRLSTTFEKIKNNKQITVGEFLKLFAESHQAGQQPYYKILPTKSMLSEFLFGTHVARLFPIKNWGSKQKFEIDFVPIP